MRKRIVSLIVILALSFSLAACGEKEPTTPDFPDTPVTPISDKGDGLPAAKNIINAFVFVAEYQLYKMNFDGTGLDRISDCAVDSAFQKDEDVVFLTGGKAYYYNIETGKTDVISNNSIYGVSFGDGFVAYREYISMNEPESVKYYNTKTGKIYEPYSSVDENGEWTMSVSALCAEDEYLYLSVYDYSQQNADGSSKPFLICYDMQKCKELWRKEGEYSTLDSVGGEVYTREYEGPLYELDEDGELEPCGFEVPVGCDIIAKTDDSAFYSSYYDSKLYCVNENGGLSATELPDAYIKSVGEYDGNYLLCCTDYYTDSDTGISYSEHFFYVVDDLNNVTAIDVNGDFSTLFSDDEFPILDSSTARKPVTQELYTRFCLQPGIYGDAPLCSTTHGAWLNIADRKADLAFLAAPTDEEKDYLEEKGVEVEMKLYGGDGLVFIGNDACGVTDLSLQQIKDIYSGKIKNWKELGGVDHEITVLYRDDQSGSQRLFENLLWKGEEVPDLEALGFERFDEMNTIVSCCVNNPYAIGYSIMTYLEDTFKHEELLAFSIGGASATPENVASGAYPLNTKGYVVIRADEPENSPARRLYDFVGTHVSDSILKMCGITPLSE